MKATDVSPLFDRDGVYRLAVDPTRVKDAPRGVLLATLIVVQRGQAFAVKLEPIDEPAFMGEMIRDEAATIVRLVDES